MIIDRLLKIIDLKGISKNRFYKETGLSNGFLDKVKDVGSSKLEHILNVYPDVNPVWLLTGKGEILENKFNGGIVAEPVAKYGRDPVHDLQRIPLFSIEATAGIVQLFKDHSHDHPVDFIQIPDLPKCDGAIYIAGDSMYPLLKSRDIVMYRTIPELRNHIFVWGEMYIVAWDNDGDQHVVVKWVHRSDLGTEYVKLVSENRHHDPIDVPKERIKALAMVKASIRINSM